MSEPDCATCGHPEADHGVSDRSKGALFDGVHYCRFGQVQDGPDSYMITCHCGHYEPMMEASDDTDRRDDRHDPGLDSPAAGPAVRRGAGLGGVGDSEGRAPVTTIHDVDRAWDRLEAACARYVARRGERP